MSEKIVVDTSVFISALISPHGASRQLLRRCFNAEFLPLMGQALFYEYEATTSRSNILAQSPLTPDECLALVDAFMSICQWTPIYFNWRPNLPDEGDNHLIELAVAGNAYIIATYNQRDFKNADLYFPDRKIIRPEELV